MAKDDHLQDQMGYEALKQEARRSVIRLALQRAAKPQGLPGDHHFYITFKTLAADVSIPVELQVKYTDEMTIVLQNQYWDLNPAETGFSVTLQFNGQPKTLSIPYAAISRFYDPSVHFVEEFPAAPAVQPVPSLTSATKPAPKEPAGTDGPKVVSLDQFRKK